jgi:hypothetical protein
LGNMRGDPPENWWQTVSGPAAPAHPDRRFPRHGLR